MRTFFSWVSFHYYYCFHNSLVGCTNEAAVHQHGEKKNSRQLFFNIASWSYFFCHGSVNTRKQGGHGSLICCHLSIAVWKHDNRSSGHTFLYVWTARILMYIYNLDVYIYESWCIYYTNLDGYIRILLYTYESWCIYTNLDVGWINVWKKIRPERDLSPRPPAL